MWSTSRWDRCLRSILLVINCAASVAVVYIYLVYVGKEQKLNAGIPIKDLIQPEKMTDEKCIPVCDSRACIWHANMFLRNMDSAVDPCDNLDYFLCGGFKSKFGFEEKGALTSESKSPMLSRLKGILDNIQSQPESASSKMKTVYDSCINYRSSELQGFIEFRNFLNRQGLLNWPNLEEDFTFSHINLPTVLGNLIANGADEYGSFSRESVAGEEADSLMLSFSYHFFEVNTEISKEAAFSILKYFDLASINMDTIIKDHELVRKSIILLYESIDCEDNCYDDLHINCSRKNDDDWGHLCETVAVFLKAVNLTDQVNPKSLSIKQNKANFYKNLFPLLDSFSDRSVANFMVLNFIKRYQDLLNFYFRFSKLKYKNFIDEQEKIYFELDTWKYCVQWISINMRIALTNEFFNHYLTRKVTKELIQFYNDYSFDIINMTANLEWMPSEGKSALEGMIRMTNLNIHVLSQVFPNDSYVNEIYEKFHPTRESFLSNALQLKRFVIPKLMPEEFIKPEVLFTERNNFEIQAAAGHPFIFLQYGMLLPPYYIPDYISLMNRISLAPLVGHEFGHFLIFMLYSGVYDIYLEKQQCVRDQFSRFKFERLNKNLNGSLFDGENMPDNVIPSLVDHIIEKYYSPQHEVILPGLPYTSKQLLYMSASQTWCSKSNLEVEMEYNTFDMHAPPEFRIIGIMQNSRGYSEAFHCPVGSFMNPAKKCSLIVTH